MRQPFKSRPTLEALEGRQLLYAVSGDAWPHPDRVTISFMPDGTDLGGVASNLQSHMNGIAGLSGGAWEQEILRGAQEWAANAGVQFALVPDDGAASGSGNYQQGDPAHGDIRIGGYNFLSSTLATAYQPPPANNFDLAGDIEFNTGQVWNKGSAYDLSTVAAHEFGHALGLDHSTASSSAVMYGTYNGVKSGLTADDIAGIRSIYGPHVEDPNLVAGHGILYTDPVNLTGQLDANGSLSVDEMMDGTADPDGDWYTETVPSSTNGTATFTLQTAGLGLGADTISVWNDPSISPGSYQGGGYMTSGTYTGGLKTFNLAVTSGEHLYFLVQAADYAHPNEAIGAYNLRIANNSTKPVHGPDTMTPDGDPLVSGGGEADMPAPAPTTRAPAIGAGSHAREKASTLLHGHKAHPRGPIHHPGHARHSH